MTIDIISQTPPSVPEDSQTELERYVEKQLNDHYTDLFNLSPFRDHIEIDDDGNVSIENNLTIGAKSLLVNSSLNRTGIGTLAPLSNLHLIGTVNGLVSSNFTSDKFIIEDTDAVMGLYSSNAGAAGSIIVMGEIDSNLLVNSWSIVRETGTLPSLRLSFGTNVNPFLNSVKASFASDGGVFMNSLKSGATQGGASAASKELWVTAGHATLPDNIVMVGA